ncbi:tetratricopeptide repeat protein [Methanosarcina sp.]|uniref:tetratricopeptide repeat protein n=1 Tax=Methanosarcina sp. TaxID=2213 RepID=UPI003BB520CD
MDYRGKKLWDSLGFSFNLDEEYEEKFIQNYRKFHKIIDKAHVLKCKEIKALKNIDTKCYFGRGSYPAFISSWQVKTNALLYDTFIFDSDTFRSIVIGAPDLDENEILRLNLISPIDIEASEFLMNLYRSGCIKLVESPFIWNNMFGSDIHTSLRQENKLYTDKKEIETISMNAALFPGDEHNYPGFLHLMNEDILVSYLTNSSIITQEYSGYISRKLGEFDQIKSKNNITDQLLKYEVPNFDSLDYDNINKIRGLRSISKFRNKIEECSQNLSADNSNIKEIVQGFRDELWKLALDNIEDNKTKIIVESLISNLPVLSSLFSARDLLKVSELHYHWGYTVLQLKKSVASLGNKENLNNHHENLKHFDHDNISLNFNDYLLMAQEYHNQDEYEKALEAIDNALKLRPDDFSAIINKIVILKNLDYESLEKLDKMIETDPHCSTHWLNKGRVLNDLGLYEEALISYKKAIEIDPKNPRAWYNVGRILAYNLGKYSKAIEYFDMAIKKEPNFDDAWMCKGSAYGDLKEHDEARKCFDKAISINPDNSCAWSNKGSALCNLGQWESGLEAYAQSLKIYPDNGHDWYLIGNAYKALSEEKKALEAYNKAIELDPSLSNIVSKEKD